MNNDNIKKIDVFIMTYKPGHKFILLLDKLLKQNYKINNIYIINTEEKYLLSNLDEDEKLIFNSVLKNDKIHLVNIKEEEFDHGKTRNICLNYSKADYIVFFTNDAIPYDDNLIKNLVEGITSDKNIKASYARQIPYENAKLKEKLIRKFNYPEYDIIKCKDTVDKYGIKNYFMSNVCAIYDFEYFKSKNGFLENIILNEDTYFAYKIIKDGYKVLYNSKAKVYHSHDYSYIKQFKRYFDIGVSHNEDKIVLENVSANKEGIKLFKYVMINMLKSFKIFSMIDYIFDMCFRYLGFIFGKNYKKLSKNICIKMTMNKNFFLRN